MSDARAALQAAEMALRAGRPAEAERAAHHALRAEPDNPAVQYGGGIMLLRAGRVTEALGPLARAARAEGAPIDWTVALAGAQAMAKQPQRAEQTLRQVLAKAPGHAVAQFNLGVILSERGALAEARAAFEASLAARPGHPGTLFALGNLAAKAGDLPAAVQSFRAAIAAQPGFAEAHSNLGGALADLGAAAEAEAALRQALALNPQLAIARLRLGDVLLATGRTAEAEAALRDAAAAQPPIPEAWNSLGLALRALGREQEAVTAFRAAVAARPDYAEALANLALMLAWLGEGEAASGVAARARAAGPDQALPAFATAVAAAVRGEGAAAQAASREAVRLQPFVTLPAGGTAELRVLMLQALGEGHFEASRAGAKLPEGHNNAAEHLDPARFSRVDLFVDALAAEPGLLDRLPPCDVIYNAITEPERMGPGLELAQAVVRRLGLPVVNPPDLIPRAARDLAPGLFDGIPDLLVPRLARVAPAADTAAAMRAALEEAGLRLPVIARPAGTHTGQGMVLLQGAADFERLPPLTPLFLTEFVDFRDADGVYRKTRVMMVDGVPMPEHLAAADDWNIHHRNSRAFMRAHPQTQADEQDYLARFDARFGPARLAAARAIGDRLGLDFFGIDCAMLADGRLLVFEANPSMRAMFLEAREGFEYLLPNLSRISAAFCDLVRRRARAGQAGG
jgi:tetratricopeptide (TPR) repeat protein